MNPRAPGGCCEEDSDCFDGDPCTVEWCSSAGGNPHCEYVPLYLGCCAQWFTDGCANGVDPCYTGACDLDEYSIIVSPWGTSGTIGPALETGFGGCARAQGCCWADVQCNDSDETTLDWCNENAGSCSFPGPEGWCDVGQGYCDGLSGMQVGTPGGLALLHVFDCDLCLNWTIRDYCSPDGRCSSWSCCESDADCNDQNPLTVEYCDTTELCEVLAGGNMFHETSGRCQWDPVPNGCHTPVDCVQAPATEDARCEMLDGTPVCHTDGSETNGVSKIFCNRSPGSGGEGEAAAVLLG